ncbi:MAG: hypothetical protein ABSF98_06185 [Bryobacteraceae bacterium]|jgi:hypothetical protein
MTIDERLEALTQTVEPLATMHRDNEAAMTRFETTMTRFAQGVNDSVTRLTRIIEAHDIVLDEHEERLKDLEDKQ